MLSQVRVLRTLEEVDSVLKRLFRQTPGYSRFQIPDSRFQVLGTWNLEFVDSQIENI
ncbi:MAG: hypothetical protein IPN69_01460 [Acidobacteria bacterium]|nr:hypothetical protein [Acidobacteriota bacterium]